MKAIYFIGFMGSGKTTLARHVCKELNIRSIDMDDAVEIRQGKKIITIFKEEGESAFRNYETAVLKEIRDVPIIATGGGIVERVENIDYMKENGTIIYLQTSFDEINRRLSHDSTRPLWKDDIANRELYERRIKMYEACANILIRSDLPLKDQLSVVMKTIQV